LFVILCRGATDAETLRHPMPLLEQLTAVSTERLANEAVVRGDARRGALVFYRSAASCASCHVGGEGRSPLGPDLSRPGVPTSATHVIESLLHPSRKIDPEYLNHSILMSDGSVLAGLLVGQTDDTMTLRLTTELSKDRVLMRDEIEAVKPMTTSIMPDGIVSALRDQREFLDLAAYVIEIARGGPTRASQLKPSPDELAVKDDSIDLDHAGIIKNLRSRDYQAGEKIYHGYCFNCHGSDGNTPSLPTARAFGTQKLKYGADPYSMFMTLTKGNGLMAPMSHLTPKERYQVVHYIREAFMRDANPGFAAVDPLYLQRLPKGVKDGTEVDVVERDYGSALASQLRRTHRSVLTIDLGELTISYDLHSLDQAGIWKNGFLDLSETQHHRPRGEGTANPDGEPVIGLAGWKWGHDGTLDYPRDELLPRGPLPKHWMDYRGYFRCGRRILMSYAIDGREILELPKTDGPNVVRHRMRIGPGPELVLAAVAGPAADQSTHEPTGNEYVAAASSPGGRITAAGVSGDRSGLSWTSDPKHGLLLHIPAAEGTREIEVACAANLTTDSLRAFSESFSSTASRRPGQDLGTLTTGGPLLWPEVISTVGVPGLEQGAYALDTLTIPDATPWNTWFRTSALDFFDDGRMVVTTYGGDVWIVSGIDDELLELKWKRFAAGLYEPFGVRVVKGEIYVTCKDRLTRLHDRDGNGEADFYENFSADEDVSPNFHAFNFDLQTDREGNFYYAKSGHGTDSDLPGAVIKVSHDGEERSVYCTGFRTPNGMGSLPDGRITASDNQGQWTPASKISLLKPGGYYGWVADYSIPGMWEPGGGTIDLSKVVPPETFDPPIVWMPQEFDNSSGGQLFVEDKRWGPLSGHLLHTSFGKGWMSYAMIQDFGDVAQAAIIKLPFDFRTGIMRARVNPADGQVYATGLQGWNGGARVGLRENGIQRLRYTGETIRMVSDCQVESDGLRLQFNFVLDDAAARNVGSYNAEHWNYQRRRQYGSEMYSPATGKPGKDRLNVESVVLSRDRKSVKLLIPELKPVHQVHLIVAVKDAVGEPFEEEIYWTINRVPGGGTGF
jgi:putative heme-binding domain-containing protein